MKHFGDILFRGAVLNEQQQRGSREAYARMTAAPAPDGLSERETSFIAARDSFYLATVSDNGWPYVQHRGGPRGFLKTLGSTRLGFGDYRGNKQYVSTGHARGNDRAALFLMDYPNRARLKILARLTVVEASDDPELATQLQTEGEGRVERLFLFDVEAFDWNCPQFITPRYTEEEVRLMIAPNVDALRSENARLKMEIAELRKKL